ncbi:MAG: hypothetical protein JWR44_1203 [Hymenobacter sp.]|jgi:hypothetical protein|nr:hypothetical protein [Hymenobacter sp.]
MHFPAFFLGLRRTGRRLVYAGFQVALWVAYSLRTLGSLRSAFGGGGEWGAARLAGPAIRPRRKRGTALGGRFSQGAAA